MYIALPQTMEQLEKIKSGCVTEDYMGALCDLLLGDLALLASEAQKSFVSKVCQKYQECRYLTSFEMLNPPLAGSYIGVGLGHQWLNLGFLERPTICLLRERFKQQGAVCSETNSEPVETMSGPVTNHDEFYQMSNGDVFVLSHTYVWFVCCRV